MNFLFVRYVDNRLVIFRILTQVWIYILCFRIIGLWDIDFFTHILCCRTIDSWVIDFLMHVWCPHFVLSDNWFLEYSIFTYATLTHVSPIGYVWYYPWNKIGIPQLTQNEYINYVIGSQSSPTISILRANPYTQFTVLICRIPLPTLFYHKTGFLQKIIILFKCIL